MYLHGFLSGMCFKTRFLLCYNVRERGEVFYFGENIVHFTYPNKESGDQEVEVSVLVR